MTQTKEHLIASLFLLVSESYFSIVLIITLISYASVPPRSQMRGSNHSKYLQCEPLPY